MGKLAFTLKEAAQAASVSVPTMAAWANKPGFPALRAGRKWVIPVDAFKGWLEAQAGWGGGVSTYEGINNGR